MQPPRDIVRIPCLRNKYYCIFGVKIDILNVKTKNHKFTYHREYMLKMNSPPPLQLAIASPSPALRKGRQTF